MKNLYMIVFSLLFAFSYAGDIEKKSIITQDLQNILEQKTDNELLRINIRFVEQSNIMDSYARLKKMPEDIRRQTVVSELKEFSAQSQNDMRSFLATKSPEDYKLIHAFWISNVMTCFASETLIQELSQRTDIDRIDIDESRQLISEKPEIIPFEPTDKSVDEITYNVTKVNADDVWALGYTGEGVIVAVLDVGINYNHVDLADHMWESVDYPYHGYDFHNDDNDPMDGHGHGTHCAGTVAGDGTAGSQTGMAPDATLMALKVLGDDGSGEESSVWAAAEFAVEQGANVLSLSLGWQHAWNPDRPTWRSTFDNVLAAGVIASIAAGNEGGSTNNVDDVRTPGDCPPPWLNPDQTLVGGISSVVCVGATDASDNIAYFSSRGPCEWETIDPYNDYPFDPEIGLLRPDVSAPGVDIKSCDAFNTNGYTMMSGTSMATPGVAGMMALLLSKNNGLSPEDICMVLETTAVDLGADGKDNVFGAGRTDILQAIENTSQAGPSYESHVINDPNGNGEIEAGEDILMSVTMFNGSDLAYDNVDVSISTESPYITMTDATENYGSFPIGESIEAVDGFAFTVSEDMPGLENIRFNVSATDGTEVWESRFDILSFGPKLSIGSLQIDDAAGNGNGRLDPGETADILITVHNMGQADAENVLLALDNSGSYLSFDNIEYTFVALASEAEATAVYTVNVSESAPEGAAELLQMSLTSGVYTDAKDFTVVIGLIVEDWETGGFDQFNWTFSGGNWSITDVNPYEGLYCSQSANISHSSQTSLVLEYEVGTDGFVSFYKKVSSESGYDYLKFFIDNSEKGSWSGEEDWSMSEYEVTAGAHTFKWVYSKDSNTSSGSDAAWVDYIILPPMVLPSVDLEAEAHICDIDVYTSTAQADNYNSLLWTTSGDGSFNDTSILDATYTPGTNDIFNGTVGLTLTANGNNGDASSTVIISILNSNLAAPNAPTGEESLCINPTDETYYSVTEMGEELVWQIVPEEAGIITAAADTAVITWTEDYTGQAEISVKVMNDCGESDFSETLLVNINPLPTLSVDEEAWACMGEDVEFQINLTGTAPWQVGIEGYEDMTVEENPYTFSWAVNQDSTLVFTSVSDANSCFNEAVSQIDISVKDLPIVNIGPDTLVCMGREITLDAGNEGATYLWSNGETSQTVVIDSTGMDANHEKIVSVMVSDEFCSASDEVLLSYQDCSGINELTSLKDITVYPNPSHGKFEISLQSKDAQEVQIEILNMLGSVVYTENLSLNHGDNIHSIDISDLSAQSYLLIIKTVEGKMVQRILID